MSEPEIVPRPAARLSRQSPWPLDAVAATAESGQAVRLALNGRNLHSVRVTILRSLLGRGLHGHVMDTKDGHFLAWATKPIAPGVAPSAEAQKDSGDGRP